MSGSTCRLSYFEGRVCAVRYCSTCRWFSFTSLFLCCKFTEHDTAKILESLDREMVAGMQVNLSSTLDYRSRRSSSQYIFYNDTFLFALEPERHVTWFPRRLLMTKQRTCGRVKATRPCWAEQWSLQTLESNCQCCQSVIHFLANPGEKKSNWENEPMKLE